MSVVNFTFYPFGLLTKSSHIMSNSFNISVKPEIAAVKAVVDANSVILVDVHDTDLPAVKTDTADIRTDATVIRDTDLPAAVTAIGTNLSKLNNIINNLLPDITTEINDNETKIDINTALFKFSYSASDTLLASADTEETKSTTVAEKLKEFLISLPGKFRITWDMKTSSAANDVYAQIYKNGVAFGTLHTSVDTSYESFSEDLWFSAGDLIQIFISRESATGTCNLQNFRVKGTIGVDRLLVTLD